MSNGALPKIKSFQNIQFLKNKKLEYVRKLGTGLIKKTKRYMRS